MAAQRDPIREWREQYARSCLSLDFQPLNGAPFHASVKPIVGEVRIVRTILSPGVVFRDEDLVRDGDDSFGFLISQSRELEATHQGREVRLGPGDATMMQASAPGGIGSRESFGFLEVMIPPAEWDARSARPGDALMQRLWRKSDAIQLLRGYIRSLERTGLAACVDGRELVHRHIIDLVVLAATRHRPIGESSASAIVIARLAAARRRPRPYHFVLPGPRTQRGDGGEQSAHFAALSAAAAGGVRNVLYRARKRAAAAAGVHSADRRRQQRRPDFRDRVGGRLFRYFTL